MDYIFFTIVLQDRTKSYLTDYINEFRSAYKQTCEHYPFETVAICILPDHIHLLMQLPENDDNYAIRIAYLKTQFTRQLPKECRQFNKIDKNIENPVFGNVDFGNI